MVVRLQTADGKIRTYKTIQGIGGGEYGPDKYITKCGKEWKNKPKPYEECDHLDCAIYLVEGLLPDHVEYIAVMQFIIILFLQMYGAVQGSTDIPLWTYGIMYGLTALFFVDLILIGSRAKKQLGELIEYRDKDTIEGIRAWQIFEDQEVAKAKHWWQFRR